LGVGGVPYAEKLVTYCERVVSRKRSMSDWECSSVCIKNAAFASEKKLKILNGRCQTLCKNRRSSGKHGNREIRGYIGKSIQRVIMSLINEVRVVVGTEVVCAIN